MDVKEHIYADDPSQGPADVKTVLRDVEYFFLGNGYIQAAVQWCRSGEGTVLGLLIMHPCRFGPKRASLTFDPDVGLRATVLRLSSGGESHEPSAECAACRWSEYDGVPAALATWRGGVFHVQERFLCPDRISPVLIREVEVTNTGKARADLVLSTGPDATRLDRSVAIGPNRIERMALRYRLSERDGKPIVEADWCNEGPNLKSAVRYWNGLTSCTFDSPVLNHLFTTARHALPAVLGAKGEMDGSIWQYNLEWVRDQAAVVSSLIMLGDFERAKAMLTRLITDFVTDTGDTVDSGRSRPLEEVELDQNGELLLAIKTYVDWTGDAQFVQAHWKKITPLAEFPLKPGFRHDESGLLHNCREYWERHAAFGIEDGMELTYQLFVSLGLSAAADLARLIGEQQQAERWNREAARLKHAMLHDGRFGLIDNGHFIKRRRVDGSVQEEIRIPPDSGLPEGMPASGQGPHYLNPDTSSTLPIALEFVDPTGALAANTLAEVDKLWNLAWEGGGYSRYHITSEPDSPGPWPFASLFVARAALEAGRFDRAWDVLNWLASAPGSRAGVWFEFFGPRKSPPAPQVGVIPWAWAELVCFFVHHLLGVRPASDGLLLRPRLLPGMNEATASLRLGEHRLHLNLQRARDESSAGFSVDGSRYPYSKSGLRLPRPASYLHVDVAAPMD